ncbi:F-box protein [Acorus gramineus]|uniref:F-box protein n=1 Tax=Acorus gramineus TaxID=55184 RepID=A0AAV9A439_ACOGR|nr:F-box protein [Acorus gramineus]
METISSRDILSSILGRLPPPDLARAACVSRLWRSIASDPDVLTRSLLRPSPWRLRRLVGSPSSGSSWRRLVGLERFAISHRIVRGDTVPGLAVRYDVQVMDIKRLNNMMSDHGIHSRDRLLIPVTNPEILHDTTCYIELDAHAKREVAMLYLDGSGPGKSVTSAENRAGTWQGQGRKVLESVKRSMHVDDGTAEYYLSIGNGDPRAAFSEFAEDLRWEQQAGTRLTG